MSKIQLGISSCLMGQKVRFDTGHKLDRYVTKTLNAYFEYLPFCPEMAIGLGTPRPAIRLQQQADKQIRAVMLKTDQDHTDALRKYADSVLPKLANISGYILKSKSPSCGMERVKVYDTKGMPVYETSPGIYAGRLQEALPNVPFEEEGRLNDPLLRENFIKRVFVYHDWQTLNCAGLTVNALIQFHTRHKMLLILHHYGHSKTLGRLVAGADHTNVQGIAEEYIALFMQTLQRLPSRRHHGQVLTRIVGTINQQLSHAQKHDILAMIGEYTQGQLPLSVPVRLIKHYLTGIDDAFIKQQSYLSPYPDELGLMAKL